LGEGFHQRTEEKGRKQKEAFSHGEG
jgi:hypothetical protein